MSKLRFSSLRTASFSLLVFLAACGQTYTSNDGEKKTTSLPKAVVNVDRTSATLSNGMLELASARPGSRYSKGISKVTATGFKNGFMPVVIIPVDNAGAAKAITRQLTEKNFISSKGKYTLGVNLDKAKLDQGTVLVVTYTLRDSSQRVVSTFTEQSRFDVPFRDAPLGAVRSKLEFIGSINNNLAQFTKRIR